MIVCVFLYLHELGCTISQLIKIFGRSLNQTFDELTMSNCRDQVMHGYFWHEVSNAHADLTESIHECPQRLLIFLLYVKEGHG